MYVQGTITLQLHVCIMGILITHVSYLIYIPITPQYDT
jgi:hypothetical protein